MPKRWGQNLRGIQHAFVFLCNVLIVLPFVVDQRKAKRDIPRARCSDFTNKFEGRRKLGVCVGVCVCGGGDSLKKQTQLVSPNVNVLIM